MSEPNKIFYTLFWKLWKKSGWISRKLLCQNCSSISKFAWIDINILNGKIVLKEVQTEKTDDIE